MRIGYFSLILLATLFGCTKTDDYLRQQFIDHGDLIDPSSAIFRNVSYRSDSISRIWCGDVNAKNRVGGYAGWSPFVVSFLDSGSVSALTYDTSKKAIAGLYDYYCTGSEPASKWIFFWEE